MAWDDREDTTIYKVAINHEQQYSIWPADPQADGRDGTGTFGPRLRVR